MTISLELLESLRDRAHVSYEEAKEALDKCNCDLVEALIYLEKQNKIKEPQKETKAASGFFATVKKLIKSCNETKLIVSKNGNTIIDLALTIVILITVFAAPITLFGLIAALFTSHKIRLEKPGCEDMKINKTLDDIATAASKVSDQVVEAVNKK